MYLLIENQLVQVEEKFSLDHIVATKYNMTATAQNGYHWEENHTGYYFTQSDDVEDDEAYIIGAYDHFGDVVYQMINNGWTVRHDGVIITI